MRIPAWHYGRAVLPPIAATLIFLLYAGSAMPRLSVTTDEWRYVQEGVGFWYTHQMPPSMINVDSQSMPCIVHGLPGAIYLKIFHGGYPGAGISTLEMYKYFEPDTQFTVLMLARWTNLLLGGVGGLWAIWFVARRLFDDRAAAIAVFIAAIEPNLAAHAMLATHDSAMVPLGLMFLWSFGEYLKQPGRRNLMIVATWFGVALGWKIAILALALPAMALLKALEVRQSLRPPLWRNAGRQAGHFIFKELMPVLIVGFMISWILNCFITGPLLHPDSPGTQLTALLAKLHIPAEKATQWRNFLLQIQIPKTLVTILRGQAHMNTGQPITFLGHSGNFAPWYFYPYLFAMKTHLLMLAGALIGMGMRQAWKSRVAWICIALLLVSCWIQMKIGVRHFLLLYAYLAMLAGIGLAAAWDWAVAYQKSRLAAAAIVITGAVLISLRSWPQMLTHTSPLWGGDARGYLYASANYDMGQGLYEAKRAADRLGLSPTVFIALSDPHFAVASDTVTASDNVDPEFVTGKVVVVGVGALYHPYSESNVTPLIRALNRVGPTGRLTDTSFYFDLRSAQSLRKFRESLDEVKRKESARNPGA